MFVWLLPIRLLQDLKQSSWPQRLLRQQFSQASNRLHWLLRILPCQRALNRASSHLRQVVVTTNTTSFQAMQTVLNVNEPLSPWKEQEVKESYCSPGYSQSFTTAKYTDSTPMPAASCIRRTNCSFSTQCKLSSWNYSSKQWYPCLLPSTDESISQTLSAI